MSDVELGGGDGDEVGGNGDDGTRDFEFTDVTYESYGSRMKNACCGVLMGIILFFGSMGVLFWNEGRNIKTQRDLDEGQEIVVETSVANLIAITVVTSTDENSIVNKLIHVTGPVTTPSALEDPIFGVVSTGTGNSSAALKLKRFVEMYQWQESSTSRTVKTANGGTRTETTYSYDKTWSSSLINSDSFKEKYATVENPNSFPFDPLELEADPILLGNVTLSSPVVSRLNWYEPVLGVSVNDISDAQIRQQVTIYSNSGFYYGNGTNAAPSVGDTRIIFEAVQSDTVSIIALFTGNSLTPYTTSRGGTLLLVKRGTFSADELFVQAEEENEQLTWILRFVGFLIMFISILIMLQPISTAVDIIPFVGDCLEGGLEKCVFPTIAFLIALPVSAFVMALGWLWYRPVIALPIVVVTLALSVWLCIRVRNKKNEHDQQQQQQGASTTPAYGKPTAAQYGGEPETYAYPPQQPTSTSLPGFAQALDNPPPSQQEQQQAIPVITGVPIVSAQPSAPVEGDVYVPQTFKP